jgi:hypothetical protein
VSGLPLVFFGGKILKSSRVSSFETRCTATTIMRNVDDAQFVFYVKG